MNGGRFLEGNSQSMNKDYITVKQNKPESIRLLAAMRHLYGISKHIRLIRIVITIIFPIISVICVNYFASAIPTIAILSAIWLILNRTWILEIEKNIVQKAAKIQEEFDVALFQINWNDILVGEKVDPEYKIELNQKFKGDRDKLKDWYHGLKATSHFYNVLLAQRTSVVWDMNLRKFYGNLLLTVFSICLITFILIGFYLNASFQTLILSLIIPSLPLLLHLIETAVAHKKKSSTLGVLLAKITNEISITTSDDIKDRCRQFQDYIYLNRCDINTVPEKVYWIKRITYDRLSKEVNEEYSNTEN